jgi:hypothetical protein
MVERIPVAGVEVCCWIIPLESTTCTVLGFRNLRARVRVRVRVRIRVRVLALNLSWY